MKTSKNSVALGIGMICLFAAGLSLQGCAVAKLAQGKPGADISMVKPGISMSEAEFHLGAHKREWTTRTGVCYRVYNYDAGVEGSTADAVGFAIFDVCTLGMAEIFYAINPLPDSPAKWRFGQIAISYDATDTVIGVFDQFGDFDRLPEDGRNPKGTKGASR
jgi:hypothetical protein